MNAGQEIEELSVSAKNLKRDSRVKTPREKYLVIKVKKGFDVKQINDGSFCGSLWLQDKQTSDMNIYMVFGPTENPRFLDGDHQKLVAYFARKFKKQARVYTLNSAIETMMILHSSTIKILTKLEAGANFDEEREFGSAIGKNNIGIPLTKSSLATFTPTVKDLFFGGY
jgi:hypothetical protein